MLRGLAVTFRLLAHSPNQAADRMLTAALDSSQSEVRTAAVRAILERHSTAGMNELARRVDDMDAAWKEQILDFPGRLSPLVRTALFSDDPETAERGRRAAVAFHEYDLIPALIAAVEDPAGRNADRCAATLIELADVLYHDLATVREGRRRRDPQIARRNAVIALEQSVQRYGRHGRREPIEAFLQLSPRDNAVLIRILCDPRSPVFRPMIEILQSSEQPAVIRLLSSFLDDPRPPSIGLATLLRRTDRRTIDHLLKRIGDDPNATIRANLRNVDSIPWLSDDALLADLDEARQQAVVSLASAARLTRERRFAVLERLAWIGKPAARRAAIVALSELRGPEVDALVVHALQDDDASVHAAALAQLRSREIPGALMTLIQALDHPAAEVRDAARANLPEFSIRRFLPAFDLLDDDVRRSTARLVRRVDPSAAERLREEMQSARVKRRMRALEVAATMELVAEVEDAIIAATHDGDHMVRAEAARALAQSTTPAARQALESLVVDASFTVRDTAEASLQELDRGAAGGAIAAPIVVDVPTGETHHVA